MSDILAQKLCEWIKSKSTADDVVSVDLDTPILERRIISSLQIMDMILYVEHLTGEPVDITKIQAGTFSSVRNIVSSLSPK